MELPFEKEFGVGVYGVWLEVGFVCYKHGGWFSLL